MAAENNHTFDMSDLDTSLPSGSGVALSEDRVGIVDALKNWLQNLAGMLSGMLGRFSLRVRRHVDVLREIQVEHDELEAKYFEERAALEARYQKLYEPLYAKRYEIVNGIVEVGGGTVTNEAAMDHGDETTEEKGVPDFWLNALKTNEVLAEKITELDEGVLKYLKDIKWCRIDNTMGFKLEFLFAPNPYFKNTVLTKAFHLVEGGDVAILDEAIGTEIEWYPGKILTRKILKKKPRKGGSKTAKPVSKTENCPSFFKFFDTHEDEFNYGIDEDDAIKNSLIEWEWTIKLGEGVQRDKVADKGDDGNDSKDDNDNDGEEEADEYGSEDESVERVRKKDNVRATAG